MKRIFSKQNRALLSELVRTDFKLRYQGSILGYAWSLLRPLFMFAIIYIVFVEIFPLGKGIPHYPVYLLLGIVMWNFFSEMTTLSTTSIVDRRDLIRKVRIPTWIVVVSTSLAALINVSLNMVVVLIFMVLNHVELSPLVIVLPVILLEEYLCALGVSLFLATTFVKFRDIRYVWEVVLQGAFYITPIIYPLTRITNLTVQKLLLLNPVAQAIQDARYVAITNQATTVYKVFDGGWYSFIPLIIVVVVLMIGVTYFRRESKYFAENI